MEKIWLIIWSTLTTNNICSKFPIFFINVLGVKQREHKTSSSSFTIGWLACTQTWYEKLTFFSILVTMCAGVNFINILRPPFCTKVFEQLFSTYFLALNFWRHKHKTLMKWTTDGAKALKSAKSSSIPYRRSKEYITSLVSVNNFDVWFIWWIIDLEVQGLLLGGQAWGRGYGSSILGSKYLIVFNLF